MSKRSRRGKSLEYTPEQLRILQEVGGAEADEEEERPHAQLRLNPLEDEGPQEEEIGESPNQARIENVYRAWRSEFPDKKVPAPLERFWEEGKEPSISQIEAAEERLRNMRALQRELEADAARLDASIAAAPAAGAPPPLQQLPIRQPMADVQMGNGRRGKGIRPLTPASRGRQELVKARALKVSGRRKGVKRPYKKQRVTDGKGHHLYIQQGMGTNAARAIANAAQHAAVAFANDWRGKGQGVQLSRYVASNIGSVSQGNFKNQLSSGLKANAKAKLLEYRAARIAYNNIKNRLFGKKIQKMREKKYGSKYSAHPHGERQITEAPPILSL